MERIEEIPAAKLTIQERYPDIELKDTIITDDYDADIPKEDWPYYYIDPNVRLPEIAKKYTPNIYTVFFNYGYKSPERMIYPENDGYSEDEEAKYQKFEDYLVKNKYHLPEALTKRRKMRFLYANKFNSKATYKNIISTLDFRREYMPCILNDEIKEIVDSGMMYLHGRDKCFRPIIVIQSERIKSSVKDLENIKKAFFFVNQYWFDNMMVPTKIENFVSVNDMSGVTMKKMPVKFVKNVLKDFTKHVKCRGRQLILLNVTFGIRAVWKLLSPMIDTNTHLRLDVTKDPTHLYLKHMVHPSQLEERFGGSAPNVEYYWPPIYPSDEFGHDPEHISEVTNNNEVTIDDKIEKHDKDLEAAGTKVEGPILIDSEKEPESSK